MLLYIYFISKYYTKLANKLMITIVISAPIVVLGILSFQTTRAQSSSESNSYAIGAKMGFLFGYNEGLTNSHDFPDPNQYCNGDADCAAGFVSSIMAGYIAGAQARPPSVFCEDIYSCF
jgi:hypothetical protein